MENNIISVEAAKALWYLEPKVSRKKKNHPYKSIP
jgi:hypothetical protein